MAGQVTMVFTADQAKFVNSVMKAQESMAKLETQVKKTTQASRQGQDMAVSDLAKWAAGLLTIQQAYQLVRKEIEDTAKAGEAASRKLQGAAAGAGDIAQMDKIESQLRGMKGAGNLGMTGRIAAYQGVRGSMPTADIGRVMGLTTLAARSTVISGGGEKEAEKFGGALGEIAKLGYTDQQAASVALMLQQSVGKYGEEVDKAGIKQVREMMAKGVKREDALGMLLASVEGGFGMKGLAEVKGGKRRELRRISRDKGYAAAFESAATGDYFSQQIDAALSQRGARENLNYAAAQAAGENASFDTRSRAMAMVASENRIVAEARAQGIGGIGQFVVGTAQKAYNAAYSMIPETFTQGIDSLGSAADPYMPEAFRRARRSDAVRRLNPGSGPDAEQAKALLEIRDNTKASAERPHAARTISR